MAKDMLDAVYAAEEEFRRREGEAKKQADKTVADAKKEAEADAKAECKQIAQTAKKNRPSVIKKAAEALLS